MRRLIVAGSVLALLLLLTLILVKREDPFGKSNSRFSVDWIEEVSRINIVEEDRELILRRVGEEWIVNESFTARKSAINLILTTIRQLEIKSPISSDLFKRLVIDTNLKSTKVEISGHGHKKFGYLIFKGADSEYGSIMKLSEKSKPFFVSLPGYSVDPGRNFVVDQKFWMPYHIFNLHPETIETIELDYKDSLMDDIRIYSKDGKYILYINDQVSTITDTLRLRRYVSYFTFIPFENWVFEIDNDLKNSILQSEPEIEFTIGLEGGEVQNLKLWIRYSGSTASSVPDTDRLYGSLNNSTDIFIVKYFDIDPIIKSSDYFEMD